MKRILRVALVAALAAIPLLQAHDSSAALRLISKPFRWQNNNRWGCTGGMSNCAVGMDTLYAGLSTSKADTAVVSVGDMVPVQLGVTASDSVRTFYARITIVSDSSAAGDITGLGFRVRGLAADTTGSLQANGSSGVFQSDPGVILLDKSGTAGSVTVSAGKVYSILVSFPNKTAIAGGAGGVADLLAAAATPALPMGWPNWQIVISANVGNNLGQIRGFISYYVDQ